MKEEEERPFTLRFNFFLCKFAAIEGHAETSGGGGGHSGEEEEEEEEGELLRCGVESVFGLGCRSLCLHPVNQDSFEWGNLKSSFRRCWPPHLPHFSSSPLVFIDEEWAGGLAESGFFSHEEPREEREEEDLLCHLTCERGARLLSTAGLSTARLSTVGLSTVELSG